MSIFRSFWRVCCLAIFSSVLCCSSVFLNAAYGVEITFGGGDSNNNGYGTPATGSYGPLSYATGTTVVFPNNAFTISGYVISGWNCQNKDDGATFTVTYSSSNNTFLLTAPNTRALTCTAQWTQCTCAEGTGVESGTCNVSVSNNQCVYDWSCNRGYQPSVSVPYTLSSGTSYTANCERIEHRIAFITGTNEIYTQTCNEGDTVILEDIYDSSIMSNVPVSDTHGWRFSGWQTASHINGTTVDYQNGDNYSCDADITLYGMWERSVQKRYYTTASTLTVTDVSDYQYYKNSSVSVAGVTAISLPALVNNTSYGMWEAQGWVKDSTLSVVATDNTLTQHTVSPAANTSVTGYYALYTRTPHVVYNANGGTGTMSNSNCGTQSHNAGGTTTNSACTLSNNGFTKTGYHFDTWYTNAAGTGGTSYAEGASYTFPNNAWASSDTVTLYAQWAQCIPITLDNTTNGGTGGTTVLYKIAGVAGWYADDQCTVTASFTAPTKTGWTYAGHYTDATTGNTSYISSGGELDATWAPTAATTLYARYTINTNTPYIVNHYKWNSINNNVNVYQLYQTDHLTGTTGDTLTLANLALSVPDTLYYVGYAGTSTQGTIPSGTPVATATILGDGTLVIDLYYKYPLALTVCKEGGSGNIVVPYVKNGTSGTQSSDLNDCFTIPDLVDGDTATLPDWGSPNNTLTKSANVFAGWECSVNGALDANNQVTMPVGYDVECAAQWTPCSCVDGNHSTCGNTASVSNNTCSYDFTCDTHYNYNNASGGTVPASAAGVESVQAPDCSPITHTITVVRDGGNGAIVVNNGGTSETVSGNSNTFTCNEGDTVTFPNWGSPDNLLTKTDNVFTGWDTSTFTCDADTTVTAQWAECSCTIQQGSHVASCSANSPSVVNNTCDYSFICDTNYNYGGASGGPATASAGSPNVTAGSCALTTHTITFKTGSTVMGTRTCNHGTTVDVSAATIPATTTTFPGATMPVDSAYGWDFDGWTPSVTTNDAIIYDTVINTVECNTDVTLYGKWSRYGLHYYAGGGSAGHVRQVYKNTLMDSAGVTSCSLPSLNTLNSWEPMGWAIDDAHTTTPTTNDTTQQSIITPIDQFAPFYYAIRRRTPQVIYDANGGTGNMSNSNCDYQYINVGTSSATSTTCTLSNNEFTKTDYNFDTWYTNAAGTGGTSYAEGASYTFPNNTWASSDTVTLYAKWQKNAYDITYDCNGGTVVGSNTTPVETFVTRTDAAQYYPTTTYSFETVGSVCEREYYTPQSWNCSYTDSNNTSHTVTAGDTVQPYNVTCLAVWDTGQIYLSWEPNNGETIETPNMCTWGGSMTGIQHPTKTGYTFTGWYLKRCLIPSTDLSNNGNANAAKRLNGGSDDTYGGATAATYGITEPGEWGVSWENGDKVTGVALCSAHSGDNHSDQWGGNSSDWTSDETTLTSATGETRYCWCKATHYTANNAQQCGLSAPAWVFNLGIVSDAYCALNCAINCASKCRNYSVFRAALFGDNVATP